MSQRQFSVPYFSDNSVYFSKIRDLPWPIWLDSGKPAQASGRYDIISAAPESTLTAWPNRTLWQCDCDERSFDDFWLALKVALRDKLPAPAQAKDTALPFNGGAMGYIGYDIGRQIERLDNSIDDDIGAPLAQLGIYRWALICDHLTKSATVNFCEGFDDRKREQILSALRQQDCAAAQPLSVHGQTNNTNYQDYIEALGRVHNYILAGDCYQVNYAQRFDLPYEGDPFAGYLKLRQVLPSQYSAYLETPETTVLSLSPECYLNVTDSGEVTTKPIKGTIARGNTPEQDERLARQLVQSEKDRAENLMIVDLLRNDLSKSCLPHSVSTPKLFELESYANVHHLVSTVVGKIESPDVLINLIRNCFPGGSITGAPKIRAMEIIEELEQSRRSIYCGSIGYIGFDGQTDLNIAIRSLQFNNGMIHCWGGGGIVADSDPAAEYQETLHKVSILTETLSEHFGA